MNKTLVLWMTSGIDSISGLRIQVTHSNILKVKILLIYKTLQTAKLNQKVWLLKVIRFHKRHGPAS